MDVRIVSGLEGAAMARGTVVVIDVFRAFTVAAVALARGADRILLTDDLDAALALKADGIADVTIGERGGAKPAGFDCGNSPYEISDLDLTGKVLAQTTTNGTAGTHAVGRADRIYTGALINAAATARAVRRLAPSVITLVAMGRRRDGRADEDEICALYLRAMIQGRSPDGDAARAFLMGSVPPPPQALLQAGDYDPRDRDMALDVDAIGFAVRVEARDGNLVAVRDAEL
jgi:2-phosphosulfolactate phosphatase